MYETAKIYSGSMNPCGDLASVVGGRRTAHVRQEGNVVQHSLALRCRFKLRELDHEQFIFWYI